MRSISTISLAVLILASILVAGLIWAAGDILAMFLIAFLLAYLFDPFAQWMGRRGVPRPLAALIITSGLLVIVGGALAVMGPIVYEQMQGLLRSLQSAFTEGLARVRQELAPYLSILRPLGLDGLVRQAPAAANGDISKPLATVVSGGIAFAGTMGLALLAPVVTFYLLKDWPRMWTRVLKEVPPAKRPMVRNLGRQVDDVLSGFLHGQAWVCLCVGVLYAIGLGLLDFRYGIVLGLISGALKFLPYIGTAIGLTVTLATAVSQGGWDGWLIAGIAATFLVVEIIESSILSPRIIGDRVHMPPALVIFAVLLGGKLLGIIGVFIAIPVFAVGRVLLGFWLHRERENRMGRQRRLSGLGRNIGPEPGSKIVVVQGKR
jgi:predicted PurR-regulated permease PerM